MIARITFLLFVATSFHCLSQTKILFVGNSLTYTNDLPSIVEKLGKADGIRIATTTIAFPNYALEDHWNEAQVANALKKTKYHYVVFQQGPSALPASRANLIEYALKFSELCKQHDTKMCLYTVCPSSNRSFDFDSVIKSYALASDTTGAVALEAGLAWKKLLAERKDFPLYSADGFHPSIHGSFLSAVVIYGRLFHKKDFEFITKHTFPSKFINQSDLDLMKRIALLCVD